MDLLLDVIESEIGQPKKRKGEAASQGGKKPKAISSSVWEEDVGCC
jgi:hypothetical protein